MIINKNIKRAEFIRRPNRFQAYVKLDNKKKLWFMFLIQEM